MPSIPLQKSDNSILFIVNPNSNSGKTLKKWNQVFLPKIKSSFPNCAWSVTNGQGNAGQIAQNAKKIGYDIVVAVGGDGTINEIVNGLFDQPLTPMVEQRGDIHEPRGHSQISSPKIAGFNPTHTSQAGKIPALGFLPTGTGCDFIKTIQIPNHFDEALKILLANKKQLCNIGKINYSLNKENILSEIRYFINVASFGASGEVVKKINKNKKWLNSSLCFWLASLNSILKNKSNHVLVYYDTNPPINLNIQVLFMANGIYCGGGMKIAKEASINDSFLNINEIQKIGRLKSIFLTNRLYSGDFSGLEDFINLRTAKKIRVEPNQESDILIECDGEQPGILPAEFSFADKNIEIIC